MASQGTGADGLASIGGDFTLTSASGPYSTASERGHVVLVYFGYTFCPDICPTTLSDLAAAVRKLPEALSSRVKVLFVSVDPERDTPARLAEYVQHFHPQFVGLTGTLAELVQVTSRYGVTFGKRPLEGADGAYAMEHPGSVFVLDARGNLSTILPHGAPVAQIEHQLRRALSR